MQSNDASSAMAAPAVRGPEFAVVIPTFCEHGNLPELVRRIETCLAGVRWEIVFVDDNSPDGTSDLARSLSQTDSRIRCVQRIGRRGGVGLHGTQELNVGGPGM
jgi:dolichol-phosphate mannosyltransferase